MHRTAPQRYAATLAWREEKTIQTLTQVNKGNSIVVRSKMTDVAVTVMEELQRSSSGDSPISVSTLRQIMRLKL
jgi:nitrogen regulatory protein PII